MRFILHIGINKTGTSSLQKTFSENADALRALGICYPETGRGGGAAHHDLSRALKGMPAERLGLPAAWREDFIAEAESCPTCLVSSEDFATMPDPAMAATLFPPGETRVVVYLREHVSHLVSWYQQYIHSTPSSLDFSDFTKLNRKAFHSILDGWARVYGSENLVVRLYDRAALTNSDIVSDFASSVFPQAQAKLSETGRANNPSLAGNLFFLKRALNLVSSREALTSRIQHELSRLTLFDPTFQGRIPVDAATVSDLAAQFARDRKALTRDFDIALRPPKGAIEGPASPDLSRLRADIELIRSEAVKRNFQIVPLIDRLLAGFAPGG